MKFGNGYPAFLPQRHILKPSLSHSLSLSNSQCTADSSIKHGPSVPSLRRAQTKFTFKGQFPSVSISTIFSLNYFEGLVNSTFYTQRHTVYSLCRFMVSIGARWAICFGSCLDAPPKIDMPPLCLT